MHILCVGGNTHEEPLFPMEQIDELAKQFKPLGVPEEQEQEIKDFAAKNVQVVIQTCNEAEYYAVLEKVKRPQIKGFEKPVKFTHGDLPVVVGTFAGINAAVALTEQGSYSQKDLEGILVIFEKATILLGLGVCMGVEDEYRYADVIVSKKIDAAKTPKIENDEIYSRGEIKRVGKRVSEFCHTAGWNTFVCTAGNQGRVAKAHVGLVFSSSNLINYKPFRKSLQRQGYNGLEMEGLVLLEMQEIKDPHFQSIIIKGISDYGDGTKDGEGSTAQVKDKWQLTAAKAAVDYAFFKLPDVPNIKKAVVAPKNIDMYAAET